VSVFMARAEVAVCKNGGSERIVAAFRPTGPGLQRILWAD